MFNGSGLCPPLPHAEVWGWGLLFAFFPPLFLYLNGAMFLVGGSGATRFRFLSPRCMCVGGVVPLFWEAGGEGRGGSLSVLGWGVPVPLWHHFGGGRGGPLCF